MSELIHVHIFEPHKPSLFGKSNKNEKSQLHLYSCENPSECDAYNKGVCINAHNVFGSRCPKGTKRVIEGFSQRAKKYHSQISEWKEKYSETLWKLKKAPERIVKVYGGWMLPYPHINMDKDLPFHGVSGFMLNGAPFLAEEDFTKGLFGRLLEQRPQALMGGEIKSYQKEVVPKFVKDLHDNYPQKYNEVANDKARNIIDSYDFVGRKAYLKTLAPNCEVVISRKTWSWDGSVISRRNLETMIFEPVKWTRCYIEFTPDDSAIVEITDNNQVIDTTILAD